MPGPESGLDLFYVSSSLDSGQAKPVPCTLIPEFYALQGCLAHENAPTPLRPP